MKQDIVSKVTAAALTILHDSYLHGSRIWPKDGFRIGDGLSTHHKECIFMGVNAYGIEQTPIVGTLHLWPTTRTASRERSQHKHIKFILDEAIHDGIKFEDTFKNSFGYLWFKFTIEAKA